MNFLQPVLAFLVIAAFGVAMFCMGYIPYKRIMMIRKNGVETVATVASISRCISDRGMNDTTDNRCYAYKLEFTTQEGKKVLVNWDQYKSARYKNNHPQGSTIRVKYLPDQPKKLIAVEDRSYGGGFLFFMILGVGLWGLAFGILILAL